VGQGNVIKYNNVKCPDFPMVNRIRLNVIAINAIIVQEQHLRRKVVIHLEGAFQIPLPDRNL